MVHILIIVLLGLVNFAQLQTFEEITRNTCGEEAGLLENLSCEPDQASNQNNSVCLSASSLCDGVSQCAGGGDEGVGNAIQCNSTVGKRYCDY